MNNYLEIKRHKNKPDQQFNCELLYRKAGYAVLAYTAAKPGLIADIHIPSGSTTIAHYWQDRPFVVWRMFDSHGTLIGTLFHICTNVSILDEHLSYDDLLLDIWISPDDCLRVLDEEELQACIAQKQISAAELNTIRLAQKKITFSHVEIISELSVFDCRPL